MRVSRRVYVEKNSHAVGDPVERVRFFTNLLRSGFTHYKEESTKMLTIAYCLTYWKQSMQFAPVAFSDELYIL